DAARTAARSGTVGASMARDPTLPGPPWKTLFRRVSARALEVHRPVRFPGLARVLRGGLLPASGGRRDSTPDVPGPDLDSVDHAVRVEGPGPVLEAADDRWADRPERIPLVEPPDRPLARLRIERAKRHPAPRARRRVEDVVLDVREASPDLVVIARSLELDPFLLAVRDLLQRPVVHLPGANLEVEAVDTVQLRGLGSMSDRTDEHRDSDRA